MEISTFTETIVMKGLLKKVYFEYITKYTKIVHKFKTRGAPCVIVLDSENAYF